MQNLLTLDHLLNQYEVILVANNKTLLPYILIPHQLTRDVYGIDIKSVHLTYLVIWQLIPQYILFNIIEGTFLFIDKSTS